MNTDHITGSRIERWATQYPRAFTAALLGFIFALQVVGALIDSEV